MLVYQRAIIIIHIIDHSLYIYIYRFIHIYIYSSFIFQIIHHSLFIYIYIYIYVKDQWINLVRSKQRAETAGFGHQDLAGEGHAVHLVATRRLVPNVGNGWEWGLLG